MSSKPNKALVTIALGENYYGKWRKYCKKNWEEYASKYDLNIHCFTKPLDTSERAGLRNPSWQKCLILKQPEIEDYDQVLWIDSDFVINNDLAPNIFENVPIDSVGGCNSFNLPDRLTFSLFQEQIYEYGKRQQQNVLPERTPYEYFSNYGFKDPPNELIHCGLLVLSPNHHKRVLEYVYNNYEQTHPKRYEMRPLAYHLIKEENITWLNSHFNTLWLVYKFMYFRDLLDTIPEPGILQKSLEKLGLIQNCDRNELIKQAINTLLSNTYFLHFAGAVKDMELLEELS